jgi:hypothetical protein
VKQRTNAGPLVLALGISVEPGAADHLTGGSMDSVILFKLVSLHVRTAQERGLKLRLQKKEFVTGPFVGHLDESAEVPDNLGVIDLTTGAVTVRWAVVATVPLVADFFGGGQLKQVDSDLVRLLLEESGHLLEDGSGFDLRGRGLVRPGSLFSKVKITAHPNLVKLVGVKAGVTVQRALATRDIVRFSFVSEASYLDVVLPGFLGTGTHRLNLVGGFSVVPLMSASGTERSRRAQR